MRLDVWLDVACLFRTRSEAQTACRNGKVDVNGATAKPHREVRVGDALRIERPLGRVAAAWSSAASPIGTSPRPRRARSTTTRRPPPTAEEVAMRRLERVFHATMAPRQRPDKRERRLLRGLKGD